MSTLKRKAKQVLIDWRDRPNHRGPFRWFETEDGRKFVRIDFRPAECINVKVYLVKKLNVVRAEKWAYELYEVSREDLLNKRFNNNWKWFGNGCEIVYEVRK